MSHICYHPDLQILHIEDNYADQVIFQENLSNTEFSAAQLKVIEKAHQIDQLQNLDYDPEVIVLDLNLPDSNGINTLKKVQKSYPNTPIVVLTGAAPREVALSAISLGAEDCLIKGKEDDQESIERVISYALERSRLKKTLIQTNQKLKRSNEKLEQFIFTVSHDLNSPITSIKGLINLLKYSEGEQDRNQVLNLIEESLQTLTVKQQCLLDVLLAENNEDQKEAINLLRLIKLIVNDTQKVYNYPDVEICIDDSCDTQVAFSEGLLHSVIQNLTTNAFKYRDNGRNLKLKFSLKEIAAYKVLAVQDNGLGIDLNYQKEKIFKLFQRGNAKLPGHGVGLYLAKSIMETNEGAIDVESIVGEGSTFYLYFQKSPHTNEL
ncbi:hypothetical protein BKI52_29640 [marine bacterium AO1-C]|nr:hypothetical protein BKI52_29640 [marine bacterium AO1-C]